MALRDANLPTRITVGALALVMNWSKRAAYWVGAIHESPWQFVNRPYATSVP